MSALGFGGRTPIGVDVGAAQIKAAQLARTRRGWRVAALAVCDRAERTDTPTDRELGRLAEVLDRAGFSGEDAVVGAPLARLHTAMLELPPRKSGAPLQQICQAEISRMFRLGPGTYESFAWEVPSLSARSSMTQMATSVLSWADASALVDPFERVGLRVSAIDLPSEATARAAGAEMASISELGALLDMGDSGIDLLVFRAGERVYQRRLAGVGVSWMVQAITRKLSIQARGAGAVVRRHGLGSGAPEPEDAMVRRARVVLREQVDVMLREVLASVSYALDRFPGESITTLRLAGGGANIPGLATYLAEASGLEVALCTPASIARGFPVHEGGGGNPVHLTALGHALWGAL